METGPTGAHVDYRHVQRLWLSQLELQAARGVARGLALELRLPLRHVTSRIRFEDVAGRPFAAREGFLHHRNETLLEPSDPWLLLHTGRAAGAWSLAARAGLALPVGHTEEDPIALGDAGLPHQHLQFGTGTVDPVAGAAVSRRVATGTLAFQALGRWALAENEHGYRAGARLQGGVSYARPWGAWRPRVGIDVVHEGAERWNGRVDDEEGNLGRTDVLASLTLGRGRTWASVQVPLATRVKGAQLDYPVIVSMGWSR